MAPLTVIALPGFTRGPEHLARFADACAERGWSCVRPILAPRWMPALYMDRRRLQSLARALVREGLTGPVVVAGHSAGAAAGCYLATVLGARGFGVRGVGVRGVGVRGVVLIDGVDSPNGLIRRSLPHLANQRIAAVFAPPSPCNRHGALQRYLADRPGIRSELVEGAGHGDIEGARLTVYRRACGDASDAPTADRFLDAVLSAIAWAGDPSYRSTTPGGSSAGFD